MTTISDERVFDAYEDCFVGVTRGEDGRIRTIPLRVLECTEGCPAGYYDLTKERRHEKWTT